MRKEEKKRGGRITERGREEETFKNCRAILKGVIYKKLEYQKKNKQKMEQKRKIEVITDETFPKSIKDSKPQVQGDLQTSSGINTKIILSLFSNCR